MAAKPDASEAAEKSGSAPRAPGMDGGTKHFATVVSVSGDSIAGSTPCVEIKLADNRAHGDASGRCHYGHG